MITTQKAALGGIRHHICPENSVTPNSPKIPVTQARRGFKRYASPTSATKKAVKGGIRRHIPESENCAVHSAKNHVTHAQKGVQGNYSSSSPPDSAESTAFRHQEALSSSEKRRFPAKFSRRYCTPSGHCGQLQRQPWVMPFHELLRLDNGELRWFPRQLLKEEKRHG